MDGPSGPLDLQGAVEALAYVRQDDLADDLDEARFVEGYSRVWERPDDERFFAVALVLAFRGTEGAGDALDVLVLELEDLRSSVPLEVPDIDDAFGYGFGGNRGTTGSPTFCNLIAFREGSRLYEVRACGPRQVHPTLVSELAEAQARRVRG